MLRFRIATLCDSTEMEVKKDKKFEWMNVSPASCVGNKNTGVEIYTLFLKLRTYYVPRSLS